MAMLNNQRVTICWLMFSELHVAARLRPFSMSLENIYHKSQQVEGTNRYLSLWDCIETHFQNKTHCSPASILQITIYPLVNSHITMENRHAIHG